MASPSLPAGSVPASCHPLQGGSSPPQAALGAVEERPEDRSSAVPGTSSKHLWLVSAGGAGGTVRAWPRAHGSLARGHKVDGGVPMASSLLLRGMRDLRHTVTCTLCLCQ